MRKKWILLVLVLVAGLMVPLEALDLRGKVTDPHGKPVIGARVTVSHLSQLVNRTATTDRNGEYEITNLPAGNYRLTITAPGFETWVQKKLMVSADSPVKMTVILQFKPPREQAEAEARLSEVRMPISREKKVGGVMAARVPAGDYIRDEFDTEEYQRIYEDRFRDPLDTPLSTFSIDVDTAAYANIRRFINSHRLPYKDVVRIEEMINYFEYQYPLPAGKEPFSIYTELSACPWNRDHEILHIGLKGREIKAADSPPSNLVFLLDVSGSMGSPAKLPLLKKSFKILVDQLTGKDRVAVVVYAGAAGLVLPSTPGDRKSEILGVMDRLKAGGSTAGGAGIKLAYDVALQHRISGGNNRIILATDGDFNVGVSSTSELVRMIEEKRDKGIFLTVLGFGTGNYKDYRMEQLADKGNGNYFYIDNILEGKKVFSTDMTSTLFTIAKDVKIQVEFNPARVKSYRLIGYENRKLDREDFEDDTKDAGELGAGHTVTALYEIVRRTGSDDRDSGDTLRYQDQSVKKLSRRSREIALIKLRYKTPEGTESKLISRPVADAPVPLAKASDIYKFSAAVAQWGLLLRDSEYKGQAGYSGILKLAREARGEDPYGYRLDFIQLVEKARLLSESGN